MLRHTLFLLFLLTIQSVFSQQNIPFRLYMYNPKAINPALTAKDSGQQLTLMGSGFVPDAPNNIIQSNSLLSFEKYFKKINSGIGLQFNHGNDGHYKTYGLFYRYGFKLTDVSKISVGTGLKITTARNFIIDNQGNVIWGNSAVPDLDAGIAFQRDNLYTGVSMTHITSPNVFPHFSSTIVYHRQLNVFAGNKFKLAKWLDLEPNVWYQQTYTSNQSKEIGLNLQTRITSILLGGGYSYSESTYSNITLTTFRTIYYKSYYASVGITAFKKLELVSLIYSSSSRNGRTFPKLGFFYEFMAKVRF